MEHGVTGTAIVLFTDVVDSTGFRTRLGDDAADAILEAHERVVCAAIESHHGSVVKYLGDGVMATFAAASDAIAAAVALCREVAECDDAHDVKLRVGLSAGDVAYRQGDCHGIPVVEAARLCDAAGMDTILASDVVRVLAGSRCAQEFEEHGRLVLKGLEQPLETVEVLWRPAPDKAQTVRLDPDAYPIAPTAANGNGAGGWPSRYELVQQVGSGGEGQVWRAHDQRHDRDLALKIRDDGSVREVRALLELRPHQNLPIARDDFTLDDGRVVVVMDWIPGDDLDAVLAATGTPGLPVPMVLRCIASVAEALDHLAAHDPPLVHGDVKPANVIRTALGEYVLVDFGASSHSGDSPAGGTHGYVAPEVARDDVGSPAADVYALAAMAVALLTGRAPDGAPPRWPGLTTREAEAVTAVVRDGLDPEPARRPRSAGELATRLRYAFESAVPVGDAAVLLSVGCGAEPGAWERRPDVTADVLARFARSSEVTAVADGGRKVATSGYGTADLFVFDSIASAVSAATDLQRLASELDRPGVGLRAKAGMHVGTLSISDGSATGAAVAKVGRLCAAANPGETAMSRQASEAIAAAAVPLPTEGNFRLRGDRDLEVKDEDPHTRLRRRRVMVAAVAALTLAVVVTAAWAYERSNRLGEDTAARRASSLASDAIRLRADKPDIAALAAVEAVQAHAEIGDDGLREATGEDVRSALLATVVTPARRELVGHTGRRVVALAVSQPQLPFGATRGRHEILASLDDGGNLRLWNLEFGTSTPAPAGHVELSPAKDAEADALTIAGDGRFAAVRTARGVEVVATGDPASLRSVAVLDGAVAPPAFGPAATNLAVDRSGRMWDLACAASPPGCGSLPPAWAASGDGIQFATARWNLPEGLTAVVSVDSVSGATVTRREMALTKAESGWSAAPIRESAFTDQRCATQKCRLIGTGEEILLDIVGGARSHVLSLVQYTPEGFRRTAAEAQVPYQPIGLFANPRGTVARPNEDTPSDSFVLMGADGDLYTQAADVEAGIGTVDSRKAYRGGGTIGVVDATATFVVGGDADGTVHLSEIAPGQSYVNSGLPETEPAIPVAGTDILLRRVGQATQDCCDLRASGSDPDEEMALGHARPATVRGATCASGRYLAVPRDDSVDVFRFPEPAAASVALPGARPEGRSADLVAVACSGEAPGVVLAVPGVGVRQVSFSETGPQQVDVVEVGDCCTEIANAVTLTGDGRFLVVADSGAGDGPPVDPDLAIWDVGSGTRLDVSALGTPPPGGPLLVAARGAEAAVVVAHGTSVDLVAVDPDTREVRTEHIADTQAPVGSIAVAPGTDEATVGTSSTIEVVSLRSGNRVGMPLMLPGSARYDSFGRLWIHVTANRNGFAYAATPLDADSLSKRACELAGATPEPDDWAGVTDHDGSDVCAGRSPEA